MEGWSKRRRGVWERRRRMGEAGGLGESGRGERGSGSARILLVPLFRPDV